MSEEAITTLGVSAGFGFFIIFMGILWFLLCVILFFKVWGMTNDIKEIRNKYLKDEDEKRRQKAEYDPSPKISGGVKTTI